MTSHIKFFSHQHKKRARATAKRLAAMMKKYNRDPDANFGIKSEAAALATRASYYLRQAEANGRIILTDHGERRQVFLSPSSNTANTD
ncbi:hypothetical protein RugamoR64_61860 [Duganella rhizosphaerae]|uniref:hypothetical protein n=1 Tax=Duganella rhizosphaerae TaxID=2885763 RepID=UPI0030EA189C